MHPVDKAQKILSGQWPKDPLWIYESPDGGKTVYRHLIKIDGAKQQPSRNQPRQLYMINSVRVDTEETLNEQYFTQVYKW